MIAINDIKLYPMTMDIYGSRTHQAYVDSLADFIENELYFGRRIDFATMRQLIDYTEQRQQNQEIAR